MRTVAALYVDEHGPYMRMSGVDPWAVTRDARQYAGPHAIVAHPPCAAWSSLRHLSRGEHRDCGPRAFEQVRTHGGVLEQPAYSTLWQHCGAPHPQGGVDAFGGYSVEVEQVSWGHVARKRTWLYFVGVPVDLVYETMQHGGMPTHWCSGGGTGRGRTPPGIKVASAQQRRRSPDLFAEWLIMLARHTCK